ncbi:MAG: hypothetical protein STSR0009_22010 [Methanoregula sp.]
MNTAMDIFYPWTLWQIRHEHFFLRDLMGAYYHECMHSVARGVPHLEGSYSYGGFMLTGTI